MPAELTPLAIAAPDNSLLPHSSSPFLSLVANGDEHGTEQSRAISASASLTGEAIADMAIASGAQCFTDQLGNSWIWLPSATPSPHREVLRLESRAFLRLLTALIESRPEFSEKPTKALLKKAVEFLDLSALAATERCVHTRMTWDDGAIFIDRVDPNWSVIRVNSSGWTEETPSQPRFYRTAHQRELPVPQRGGDYKALFSYLAITEAPQQLLTLAWILSAFHPAISSPILLVVGPPGSAKTTRCRRLRSLIDPSHVDLLGDIELGQIYHTFQNHAVPVFENVGTFDRKTADAFCRAVTGTATERRKLFTDAEQVLFNYRRSVIINSLAPPSTRPDFLDRCLMLHCQRLERFEPLKQLDEAFEKDRPAILGGLLDLLSKTLASLDETLPPTEFRLADFAHFGRAVALALGQSPEDFDRAYADNIAGQCGEIVEDSAIAQLIIEFGQDLPSDAPWIGSITELRSKLKHLASTRDLGDGKRDLQKSARWLSSVLGELGPALMNRGIEVCCLPRTRNRRPWKVSLAVGTSLESAPFFLPSQDAAFPDAAEKQPDQGSTPELSESAVERTAQ
jgi:hypothetical protein